MSKKRQIIYTQSGRVIINIFQCFLMNSIGSFMQLKQKIIQQKLLKNKQTNLMIQMIINYKFNGHYNKVTNNQSTHKLIHKKSGIIQTNHTMSSPYKQQSSYQRKIYLLQGQNMTLVQELQSMRYKLRNIQDIQVKYQLLLGQSQNQNQQLRLNHLALQQKLSQSITMILQEKQSQLQQVTKRLQQQHRQQILDLRQRHQHQKQQQDHKYNQLKQLYEILSTKSQQIDVFSFKLKKYEKQIEELQEQLETQKLSYQSNKERQLSQLKLNITKKLKSKHQNQTQSLQLKIKTLQHKLHQVQLQNDLLNEKAKNLYISETSSNIDKLNEILSNKKSLQRQQHSKLQEALDKANSTLRKVIEEKYQAQQKHITKHQQLKQYIGQLQNQLLEKEKSHTKQIFTLNQKHLSITQEQSHELHQHINSLKDNFQREKLLWDTLAQDHADSINTLTQDNQRLRVDFEQQKHKLKYKIKDLKTRLQDVDGKKFEGETQQMIASLKDIDSKQDKVGNYENGIVFFQRQLAKANMNIAKKDKEISKLLQEIIRIRAQSQSQTSGLREKYKIQKKEFIDKIFTLQNQVTDLSDKLRFKERELLKKEKDSSFQVIELEKRIEALQDLNNQVKKDYDRAVTTCKTLEQQYRGERDRGVSAKGDANYAKRIKWLELQKQKNELTIIFRQKEEQMKILYEKQIDQLRNQRDALKQKSVLMQQDNKRLAGENAQLQKRLDNKENVNGKSSKKKAGQMEKKIASLNLEISLTKNLFQNLQKAKSRLKSRDFTERPPLRESEPSQQSQDNEQDFD